MLVIYYVDGDYVWYNVSSDDYGQVMTNPNRKSKNSRHTMSIIWCYVETAVGAEDNVTAYSFRRL